MSKELPDEAHRCVTEKPPEVALDRAIGRTALVYDYFSPRDITRRLKPSALNAGSQGMKGTVTSVAYDKKLGLYTAYASLGNVTAHDHLREMTDENQPFGYVPPDTFAHEFGAINATWYPRVDKVHLDVLFEGLRDGATLPEYEEGRSIAWALGSRLEYATAALGRSIKIGAISGDKRIRGRVFEGPFNPRLPMKESTSSTVADLL